MNNENFHPVQAEPPLAHALHHWDGENKTLAYEYNGKNIIEITMPEAEDAGFRHGSDGSIQSVQYMQQIYLTVEKPMRCVMKFRLSGMAVNMKPQRAQAGEAIFGQLGTPLIRGVNGLYDILQDLLIDFHGCSWEWNEPEIVRDDGSSVASITVLLSNKPLFLNLRMQYYRKHLGYHYHRPWAWRPDERAVAGWCSWEAYRRDITQKDVEQTSLFLKEHLLPYGADILQVDDGYQQMPLPYEGGRSMREGWMACEQGKFPAGHEGIVGAITAQGLTAGIWTNSNITNPDFPASHQEDVIWHGGVPLKGEWIDYLYSCLPGNLRSQVIPLFEAYREKGYGYVKIDAIRHLLFDGLHEAVRLGIISNDEAEQRFRAYMEATRQGLGEDIYYLASWGEMHEVVGVVDACRISMDANPTWAGVRMQLFESARWYHTQRILFLNDPDHVCARTKIEWAKSVLSLISLSGELYMLSDSLSDYTAEKLEVIQKTLPPLTTRTAETGPLSLKYPAYTWTKLHGFAVQSSEKPVVAEDVTMEDALNMAGEYEGVDADHPFSSLWAFHLRHLGSGWCVAGRFATMPLRKSTIQLATLGLDPALFYHAFDFWEQSYLGTVTQHLEAPPLEIGHCQIIALRPVLEQPQFIASSRHVSMDSVSLKGEDWTQNELVLNLEGVAGTSEDFFVHCNSWKMAGHSSSAENVCIEKIGGLLKISVPFSGTGAEIKIRFQSQ